jgi:hypothetical protein
MLPIRSAAGELLTGSQKAPEWPQPPNSLHTLMIRKLESIFPLSDEEKQALQNLPVQLQVLKVDHPTVADLDAAQG